MTNTAAFTTGQSSAVDVPVHDCVTKAMFLHHGHAEAALSVGDFFQYPKWLLVDFGTWWGLFSHILNE